MPKVSKKRSSKKTSSKVNKKSKASKGSRKKRSTKDSVAIDTFQSWIDAQAKKRHGMGRESKPKEIGIPTDSMQEWLKRQPVVEKERPAEGKIPLGSMDEWLQKQVTAKLSVVEETPTEVSSQEIGGESRAEVGEEGNQAGGNQQVADPNPN